MSERPKYIHISRGYAFSFCVWLTNHTLGYNIYTMEFEYDDKKSASNKKKHGIDFIEAQILWKDDDKIIFPARSEEEERKVLIGAINNKHWSAIYTVRNEKVRLISVRRSRKEEEELYES